MNALPVIPTPTPELADMVDEYVGVLDLIDALVIDRTTHQVLRALLESKDESRARIYRHVCVFGQPHSIDPRVLCADAGVWQVQTKLDQQGDAIYLVPTSKK